MAPNLNWLFLALAVAGSLSAQQPVIITPSVPNGEVGVVYQYPSGLGFTFAATNGNVNSWSVVSGSLPPGLTLSSSGTLGGFVGNGSQAPTTAGTYSFTVQVTCDCSGPGQADFSMTVFPTLTATTQAILPPGTVGQPYQYTFTAEGGDQAQLGWSIDSGGARRGVPLAQSADRVAALRLQPNLTSLVSQDCSTGYGAPPGLCLDSSGLFQGTPTTPGTYNFFVVVFDSDIQNYRTFGARMVVSAAPVSGPLTVSSPVNLGTIVLGNSISGGVTASGGAPPYTFTMTGLPAGVVASGSGVTGTPTAPGNYGVGVAVSDTSNANVTSGISFSVFGISTTALPPGVISSPYSFFVTAAGGSGGYTYTATGLPPKFSFGGNGWLNGTPSGPGNYTIAVTARDGNGLTHSATFPLAITGPTVLKVPGGPLSDMTVQVPNSQTLSATGGAPPYSWSVAGGSFPDGLTLRSSGTVSGTAAKAGSYTFSARATDVSGGSGVGAFTLNVKAQPVVITTPSPLSTGMITVDYPEQVLTAEGGFEPYAFTVTKGSLPPGLTLEADGALTGTPTAVGDYLFTVTATDANSQTGTAQMAIKVRPFSADLMLSAGSLSFRLAAGSSAVPDLEVVQVQATDVTKPVSYSVTVPSAPAWLNVVAPGSSTPGAIKVSLTSAALSLAPSATPYQASIVVTCVSPSPCAGNAQTVIVTLAVNSNPPALSFSSDLLSFTTPPTNPQATTESLVVKNTGGGTVGFASVTCSASWCKVGTVPSQLGGGAAGDIHITADPTGLNPGFYVADLKIVSSVGSNTIQVNYFIAANSTLTLDQGGESLTSTVGGQVAVPDTSFLVAVSGTASVPWTAAVLPGAPWLQLVTTSGTSTGTAPGAVNFSVDETAVAALAVGTYYGTIRVTAPSTVNSPQDFQVVLNVTTTSKTKPNPTPAGLLFLTTATGTPPPQIDQIFASSTTPVTYQASAATESNGTWLSVNPTVGTTSASNPGQGRISVSPAGLAPGVYHGTVSYSFSASAVRSVNITMVVEAAGLTPGERSGAQLTPRAATLCTPKQIIPTQTGLVSNFAAPASWPTPLEITLVDDCGSAVGAGQLVATFSNGDPPLLLGVADPLAGKYSASWTPRHTGAQVTVTARASVAGFPDATTQIAGAVVPNVAPVLTPNGTLHVFSPQVGAPVAPGTIVQIYGSQLATQVLAGTTIPLQTKLAGTSVIIGGLQAPLYFVSPGQVNAQVPFELAPGQPYQVIVSNNGALSTPNTLEVGGVTPGVAAFASGTAIAQHVADGSLVTEASPAKPGEYVVLYLAGMGATTVPVPSGAASPASPLAQTLTSPTITLNTASIVPLFSGLTPGLAGLYQIDFQIPADAPDGDLNLVVSQPGFQGGAVLLPVHH